MVKVAAGDYQYSVAVGLTGLEGLKPDWVEILRSMERYRYIHHWKFYEAFLKALAPSPDSVIFVLARSSSGTPLGIFPLQRKTWPGPGLGLPAWGPIDHPHVFLKDFVVSPNWEPALYNGLWDLMKGLGLHVCFRGAGFPEESTLLSYFASVGEGRILRRPGPFSAFVNCQDPKIPCLDLSTKFRRNLRRKMKRASEVGEVTFSFVGPEHDQEGAFSCFLEVESSGWKGERGKGTAIDLDDRLKRFYGGLLGPMGDGGCQINLMTIDGTCVAAQFCIVTGGILQILKIGFAEDFRSLSPGELLLFKALEWAQESSRIDTVSFVTDPPWLSRLPVQRMETEQVFLFSDTVLGGVSGRICKMLYSLKNTKKAR